MIEEKIACISQVLCDMPMLEIDFYVVGQFNDESDVLQRVRMPSTKDDWIQIHQNEVCVTAFSWRKFEREREQKQLLFSLIV